MRPSLQEVPRPPHESWHLSVRVEPRFGFDWHYHPEYELTLIVRGSGRRYVGDAVHEYGPGDLVLVGADTPHTWESADAGGNEAVVLQFRRETFGPGLFDLPELHRVDRLLAASAPGLRFPRSGSAAIAELMCAMPGLDPARRTLRLLEILVALCDLPQEPLATRTLITALDASARQRIERVISYVSRDYPAQPNVRDAARLVSMTPNAFSRFFRRGTGRTFSDYVNAVRLAHACRRLIEDDAPVSQIAAESGYGNLSHFNRRFRARTGMSPREFRRHFRPREGSTAAEGCIGAPAVAGRHGLPAQHGPLAQHGLTAPENASPEENVSLEENASPEEEVEADGEDGGEQQREENHQQAAGHSPERADLDIAQAHAPRLPHARSVNQ